MLEARIFQISPIRTGCKVMKIKRQAEDTPVPCCCASGAFIRAFMKVCSCLAASRERGYHLWSESFVDEYSV